MVWLQPRASIKALRLLGQQNAGREGGKDHCVLQGEGRNKNGPYWGVREGVKTAGARSQAAVGPAWLWGLFLTGGRTSKVPRAGLEEEGKESACLGGLDQFPSGHRGLHSTSFQTCMSQPCARY